MDSLPGFRLGTKVNYGVFGTFDLGFFLLELGSFRSGRVPLHFLPSFFLFSFRKGECLASPDQPIILTCILNFNMLSGSMQYIG